MAPATWTDLFEVESIKILSEGHRTRFQSFKTMRSGPGNTIMCSQLDGTSYVTYRVVESGLLIGMSNVATAIPKGVGLAVKNRKTTAAGLTEKLRAPRARAKRVASDE